MCSIEEKVATQLPSCLRWDTMFQKDVIKEAANVALELRCKVLTVERRIEVMPYSQFDTLALHLRKGGETKDDTSLFPVTCTDCQMS